LHNHYLLVLPITTKRILYPSYCKTAIKYAFVSIIYSGIIDLGFEYNIIILKIT